MRRKSYYVAVKIEFKTVEDYVANGCKCKAFLARFRLIPGYCVDNHNGMHLE